MNTQTQIRKQISINYGLISGGIGVVFSLMLYFMDALYNQDSATQWITTLISVTIIVLGIVAYKKSNDGLISLNESIKLGLGISLVSALITCAYMILLANVIEPDFYNNLFESGKAAALEQNPKMTSEQLDQMVEMQKKFSWVTYPAILIVNLFIGLVVGLVTGLIVKKSKPEY